MTVTQQAYVFAAMAVCGTCIGLIHDLMAICRRGVLWTAASDLFLGFVAAVGMIAAGLALQCDPFRWYAFAGAAAGWTVYAVTLGLIVRLLMRKFIELSKKVTSSSKNGKIMQEK